MGMDTRERLELGGTRALEHAGELRRRTRSDPLFRLWVYSPQGTNSSWTLFSPRSLVEGGHPVLREVVWSRRQDEEQLDSSGEGGRRRGEPNLRIRDREISAWDQDRYRGIVGRLRPSKLQQVPPSPSGDHFGIEGYGPLDSVRMEWQGAGPIEWSDPIRRVTQLRNQLIGIQAEPQREVR